MYKAKMLNKSFKVVTNTFIGIKYMVKRNAVYKIYDDYVATADNQSICKLDSDTFRNNFLLINDDGKYILDEYGALVGRLNKFTDFELLKEFILVECADLYVFKSEQEGFDLGYSYDDMINLSNRFALFSTVFEED